MNLKRAAHAIVVILAAIAWSATAALLIPCSVDADCRDVTCGTGACIAGVIGDVCEYVDPVDCPNACLEVFDPDQCAGGGSTSTDSTTFGPIPTILLTTSTTFTSPPTTFASTTFTGPLTTFSSTTSGLSTTASPVPDTPCTSVADCAGLPLPASPSPVLRDEYVCANPGLVGEDNPFICHNQIYLCVFAPETPVSIDQSCFSIFCDNTVGRYAEVVVDCRNLNEDPCHEYTCSAADECIMGAALSGAVTQADGSVVQCNSGVAIGTPSPSFMPSPTTAPDPSPSPSNPSTTNPPLSSSSPGPSPGTPTNPSTGPSPVPTPRPPPTATESGIVSVSVIAGAVVILLLITILGQACMNQVGGAKRSLSVGRV